MYPPFAEMQLFIIVDADIMNLRILKMSASLRVVNVIASTRIKGQIDIEELSQILRKAQYEPGNFPGLVYRRSGYPTIIMFASGKISSHGARNEADAREAILQTLIEIDRLGLIIGNRETAKIAIENVVGTADLRRPIDLELITNVLPKSMYEPEQFPGLILRLEGSIVCLLFSTGKIVIAGAKSEPLIQKAFEYLLNLLREA